MTLASGTNVSLWYVRETTHGTTPSTPTLKALRAITRNLGLEKDILASEEVRPSRQRADVRHGFNRVTGSIEAQLSVTDFDDAFEDALGGTWAAVTTAGSPDISVASNVIIRATGNWINDGYRVGDIIAASNFTQSANDGLHRVTALTSTNMTVAETLTDEGSGAGKTVVLQGKRLDVGTTLYTNTYQRKFSDITKYQVTRGVTTNQLRLSFAPERIIRLTLDLLGMSGAASSGSTISGATEVPASTNPPLANFEGTILIGGTTNGFVTDAEFGINNQRRLQAVIGSRFSPDVFDGTAIVEGRLTFITEDLSVYDLFFNETESSVWIKANEPGASAAFLDFKLYRVKFNGDRIDPAQEGPVFEEVNFEALESSTYGTALSIQRSNS